MRWRPDQATSHECPHPQLSNLVCYQAERDHAYELGPHMTPLTTTAVNDFWCSGVPLPSRAKYGMGYIVTGENDSVVHFGAKVQIKEVKEADLWIKQALYALQCIIGNSIIRIILCVVPKPALLDRISDWERKYWLFNALPRDCGHTADFEDSVGLVVFFSQFAKGTILRFWRNPFGAARLHSDLGGALFPPHTHTLTHIPPIKYPTPSSPPDTHQKKIDFLKFIIKKRRKLDEKSMKKTAECFRNHPNVSIF